MTFAVPRRRPRATYRQPSRAVVIVPVSSSFEMVIGTTQNRIRERARRNIVAPTRRR